MKKYSSLLFASVFLLSTQLFASNVGDIKVKSVWQEKGGEEGKQFLVHLASDRFNYDGSVVILGTKNGQPKLRQFLFDILWGELGNRDKKGRDDFYEITIHEKREHILPVTLVGRKPGYDVRLNYLQVRDVFKVEEVTVAVEKGLNKVYAKLDELAAVKTPDSIAQLRELIALHLRSHFATPEESSAFPWQFEIQDGHQIEAAIAMTPANSRLAKAKIKADASDPISRKFNRDKVWTKEANLPDTDDLYAEWQENEDTVTSFTSYSTKIEGGLDPGPIKNGVKKFLKYAIFRRELWECEDFTMYDTSFVWVLVDGSAISYTPTHECD